jgi:hypothetical protein
VRRRSQISRAESMLSNAISWSIAAMASAGRDEFEARRFQSASASLRSPSFGSRDSPAAFPLRQTPVTGVRSPLIIGGRFKVPVFFRKTRQLQQELRVSAISDVSNVFQRASRADFRSPATRNAVARHSADLRCSCPEHATVLFKLFDELIKAICTQREFRQHHNNARLSSETCGLFKRGPAERRGFVNLILIRQCASQRENQPLSAALERTDRRRVFKAS